MSFAEFSSILISCQVHWLVPIASGYLVLQSNHRPRCLLCNDTWWSVGGSSFAFALQLQSYFEIFLEIGVDTKRAQDARYCVFTQQIIVCNL